MKILPNGNIEITVQLFPGAYAALVAVAERDGLKRAEVVNVAIALLAAVSEKVIADGEPFEGAGTSPA